MCHRLRFAMTQHNMIEKLRGVVEIDEVYIGPKEKGTGLTGLGRPESKKRPVVSLMERHENGSRVRSFHVERVTLNNIKPIMKEHVEVGTTIQTDEATVYHFMHEDYPVHDVVTHKKKEYSRYEWSAHHHQHSRGILRISEARRVRNVSPLGTRLHAAIPQRIRFQVQQSKGERFRANNAGTEGNGRKAAHTTGTKTRFGVESHQFRIQMRLPL